MDEKSPVQDDEAAEIAKMTGKWKLKSSASKTESRPNRSLSVSSSQEWSFSWNISKSQSNAKNSSPISSPQSRREGARSKSFSADQVPNLVLGPRFAPYSPKESRLNNNSPKISSKVPRSGSQNSDIQLIKEPDVTRRFSDATEGENFENVNLKLIPQILPTEEQKLIENLTNKFLTFKLPPDVNRPQ